MNQSICTIENCTKPAYCKSWCQAHYSRAYKHGDPLGKSQGLPAKACAHCGNDFRPRTHRMGFCTARCQFDARGITRSDCTVEGCDNPFIARGMCSKHYQAAKVAGMSTARPPERDRFNARVVKEGDCHIWHGNRLTNGYGVFYTDAAANVYAHRYAYEMANGAPAEGRMIDHMCHTPACVNPAHLREATPKQNVENYSGMRSDNTSKHRGAFYCKDTRRWRAIVSSNGKRYDGGRFPTAEAAGEKARQMRLELHSHNLVDQHPNPTGQQ